MKSDKSVLGSPMPEINRLSVIDGIPKNLILINLLSFRKEKERKRRKKENNAIRRQVDGS